MGQDALPPLGQGHAQHGFRPPVAPCPVGDVRILLFPFAAPLEEFTSCYQPQDIAKNNLRFLNRKLCLSEVFLVGAGVGPEGPCWSPRGQPGPHAAVAFLFPREPAPHESPLGAGWRRAVRWPPLAPWWLSGPGPRVQGEEGEFLKIRSEFLRWRLS